MAGTTFDRTKCGPESAFGAREGAPTARSWTTFGFWAPCPKSRAGCACRPSRISCDRGSFGGPHGIGRPAHSGVKGRVGHQVSSTASTLRGLSKDLTPACPGTTRISSAASHYAICTYSRQDRCRECPSGPDSDENLHNPQSATRRSLFLGSQGKLASLEPESARDGVLRRVAKAANSPLDASLSATHPIHVSVEIHHP